MDTLQNDEDGLLNAWCAKHRLEGLSNFIADGIVDHATYSTQRLRALILLREPNWPATKDQAYRQDLLEGIRAGVPDTRNWRNWQVVARWICALTDQKSIDWNTLRHHSLYNIDFRQSQFRKVAVVNVKKEGGGNSLRSKDWERIINYCKRENYGELIEDQIILCCPQVVLCSGTFRLLLDCVDAGRNAAATRCTQNSVQWCQMGSYVAIDLPHFGARGKGYAHQSMQDRLAIAWPEIKEKAAFSV